MAQGMNGTDPRVNDTTNRDPRALYAAGGNFDIKGDSLNPRNNPFIGGSPQPIQAPQQPQQPGNNFNFSTADPNDIATLLGTQGYTPGYDSNQKGSFEGNFNNVLDNLNPDQLLKRYSIGNTAMYQTPKDQLNYRAYQTAKSLLGRDVTANEFAQILPAFQGPNGLMNGQAFLANLQQQYKSNPSLDPMSQQNNQKPGDVSNQVTQQFQSILGRAPTSDELSHFSQAVQTGQTDAYGLGSFLKQMPEYTNAQDKTFRQGLNEELTDYDTGEFNIEKGDVMGQYMQSGLGQSSSLNTALTDLMGKIAENRSSYLASLSAGQYGGNKDLAISGYKGTLDQMNANNSANRNNQMAYGNQLLNQGYAGADYSTQMKDYLNYMNNNKGSSQNPLYGAIGGLLGAGVGGLGSGGSPQGAMAGYQIGQGAGNAFGYLNR